MRKFSSTATWLAAAIALSVPAAAFAHAELVSATPAANKAASNVSRVTLTFNEALTPRLSGATLTMTGMPGHGDHETAVSNVRAAVNARTITLTAARPLAAGTYRVDWHAVTDDSHRITGKYSFTVS